MIIQLGFKRVYFVIVKIPKEDTIKQIGFHDNTVRIQKSIYQRKIQLAFMIVEIPKEDTIKQIGFHDNTVRIQKSISCDSENTKGRYNKTNRLS